MSEPAAPPKKAFSFDLGFGDAGATPAATALPREARAPIRLLVVAPLAPPAHARTSASSPSNAKSMKVDRATLDEAFAAIAPSIALQIPDPIVAGARPLDVTLPLGAMRALRPASIAEGVEIVRALLDARHLLDDVRNRRVDRGAARATLATSLSSAAWAEALLGAATATPVQAQAQAHASAIDSLLSQVGFADEPETTSAATLAPAATTDPGAAALAIVKAILAHPELRRLEEAWRGVDSLLRQTDAKTTDVELIAAELDDVAGALVERLAAEPGFDLIAVDHDLAPTPADLDRLERWAAIGEATMTPIVVGGTPALLGFDDLATLARSSRRFRDPDGARAIAFASLRARPALRWAVVAMNRVVARPLHEARIGGLELREEARDTLRVGAGFAVLIAAARAHARAGIATGLVGAEAGRIDGLPVAPVALALGEASEAAVASLPDHDVVAEAALAGVTLLAGVRNRDAVVLLRAVMVGGTARASTSLADQLFVAQIVRRVSAALRGASGVGAEARVLAAKNVLGALLGETPIEVVVEGPSIVVRLRPAGFQGVTLEDLELEWPAS